MNDYKITYIYEDGFVEKATISAINKTMALAEFEEKMGDRFDSIQVKSIRLVSRDTECDI